MVNINNLINRKLSQNPDLKKFLKKPLGNISLKKEKTNKSNFSEEFKVANCNFWSNEIDRMAKKAQIDINKPNMAEMRELYDNIGLDHNDMKSVVVTTVCNSDPAKINPEVETESDSDQIETMRTGDRNPEHWPPVTEKDHPRNLDCKVCHNLDNCYYKDSYRPIIKNTFCNMIDNYLIESEEERNELGELNFPLFIEEMGLNPKIYTYKNTCLQDDPCTSTIREKIRKEVESKKKAASDQVSNKIADQNKGLLKENNVKVGIKKYKHSKNVIKIFSESTTPSRNIKKGDIIVLSPGTEKEEIVTVIDVPEQSKLGKYVEKFKPTLKLQRNQQEDFQSSDRAIVLDKPVEGTHFHMSVIEPKNNLLTIIVVILAILLIVVGIFFLTKKKKVTSFPNAEVVTPPNAKLVNPPMPSTQIKYDWLNNYRF